MLTQHNLLCQMLTQHNRNQREAPFSHPSPLSDNICVSPIVSRCTHGLSCPVCKDTVWPRPEFTTKQAMLAVSQQATMYSFLCSSQTAITARCVMDLWSAKCLAPVPCGLRSAAQPMIVSIPEHVLQVTAPRAQHLCLRRRYSSPPRLPSCPSTP